METAQSYLALMPVTKAEVKTFQQSLKDSILSGENNAFAIAIQLKAMEDVITGLRKDKDVQAEIMNKIKEKVVSYSGHEITVREVAKYDYSIDSKWSDLQQKMDELKEKQKNREAFLKTIESEIVDTDTGEVMQPLMKTWQKSLVVTLK